MSGGACIPRDPVRIGLDATCFDDRPSGANQRFRELYGQLIRANPQVAFVVYEAADCGAGAWYGDLPNVTVRRTPVPGTGRLRRFWRGRRYWRRALARDALDLFETFTLPLVVAPDCPTILTIHDLRGLRADVPRPARWLAAAVTRHAFARAAHIIAVSDTVRDEILAVRPGTPVSTIYNGVIARSPPDAAEVAAVVQRHTLPARFALTVGHLEPRKNLPMLVDAFACLRDAGRPLPLVIVGNDGGARGAIEGRIARHGMSGLVSIIAQADDGTVAALYAACAVVVLPSAYEGFGIPLIEAMAAHKPVVTSDIAVFRELTCGNGVYFAPDAPRGAAAVIDRLMSEPIARARLVAFADTRVGDFDFTRLAGELAALQAQVIRAA